jgi:polyhydroxybutyrate depolymerase
MFLLAVGCQGIEPVQTDLPGEASILTVRVDGVKRTARFYEPAGYQNRPLPIIFVLHGSGSDSHAVAVHSRMSEAAQSRGFVVVYPDALPLDPTRQPGPENPRVWSDGSGRGFAGKNPENDIRFLSELMQRFRGARYDTSNIHIVGFSNGGSMSFRVARELPHKVRRVAVISGVSWLDDIDWPRQDLLYITGGQDYVIPPDRPIRNLPFATIDRSTSVNQTLMQWMDRCRSDVASTRIALPRTLHSRSQSFQCSSHSVQYIELPRTGHVWPGGPDDTVAELDATNYVVRFLLEPSRRVCMSAPCKDI